MTEEKTQANAEARPGAICTIPGCGRPREDSSFPGCAEHRRLYDAQALTEAWDLVCGIVGPWLESTEKIGSEELTRVMQGAFEEAEREYNSALDEREAAEAAL